MPLAPGTRLGPYEILSPLGAGGMGEVYRARHEKLGREAAVKVLPADVASDPERRKRFEREARAASALNHPAIVTIYDIGDHDGTTYIAMELVEGETLRERLGRGPVPTGEALSIATRIAEGLARAHGAGIVHRDLKPDNVMLTRDGAKILDFGLAKRAPLQEGSESEVTTMSHATREGVVLGTVPYMSPEQAAGAAVGPRSDQFSFGVVLYEMLGGQRPFQGPSIATVLSAILRDKPRALREVRPGTPRDVEDVVGTCLEKDPGRRFASTEDLAAALRGCEARLLGAAGLRVPRWLLYAAAALAIALGGAVLWWWRSGADVRWAERVALPEINRRIEAGELFEAYRLALKARVHIPDSPELQRALDRITLPVSVTTDPPGAQVSVQAYAATDEEWEPLGATPLEQVRIPYALMRWRIEKDGYEPFVGAPFGVGPFTVLAMGLPLDPVGSRPPGMVRVPGGTFARPDFPAAQVGPYWLDVHEVTNRQFKEFLDGGGYEKAALWTEGFRDEGREISRADAMERMKDATGRPGPATWEVGGYREGEGDFPVGGVSWYEASAYCRAQGKSLPTIHQWYLASAQDQVSDIVRLSNFGSDGPAPVGSHAGLGDYGTYDMAGNVKEWCRNATGSDRYILGGAWNEPTYMFRLDPDARPPLERLATHGFRCARPIGEPDPSLALPIPRQDPAVEAPVSDDVFEAYRRLFAYDSSELAARVEAVDESAAAWRRETVSFRAAYGNERVIAQVLLPRDTPPPYQTVVWFPGNDAFFVPSSDSPASAYLYDFLPRSGRALVYPVYKGMYERRAPFSRSPNEWRDMLVAWSRDIGRTLDYLATRDDVDGERLAYYGFSLGARYGPLFTAIDPRFEASVLLAGGLYPEGVPEISVVSYAPRSRVPTLMINGRDDFLFPLETSQQPLFRRLGASDADKRHALLEGGHIPADRREIIREVLDWLDQYLGPVREDRLPPMTPS
jgi:hypothetical protein